MLVFLTLITSKLPQVPFFNVDLDPENPIVDKYAWIRFLLNGGEQYLTLKSDGGVSLSIFGKYKIKNPTVPSLSLRQKGDKIEISIENQKICAEGPALGLVACKKKLYKNFFFKFMRVGPSYMITQNMLQSIPGMRALGSTMPQPLLCLTVTNPVIVGNEFPDEFELRMMPCKGSVRQLWDITLTNMTNVDTP